MPKIDRRSLLKQGAATAAGAAAAASGVERVLAAGSPSLSTPSGSDTSGGKATQGVGPRLAPPVTAGVAYKSYRGQDFKVRNSTTTWNFATTGGDFYIVANPDYIPCHLDLPNGCVVSEIKFDVFNISAGTQSFFFSRFDSLNNVLDDMFGGSLSTTSASVQTFNLTITPTKIDTTQWAYVLYWGGFAVPTGSDHRIGGARVGYTLAPGLVTFPNPRRCFGDGTLYAADQVIVGIDAKAIIPSKGGGSTGVPVGAKAAFCAVQSYQGGAMTLYPFGSPDPGLANWGQQGQNPNLGVQMLYMLVPLDSAFGRFNLHNNFTDKQIFIDVWGYQV